MMRCWFRHGTLLASVWLPPHRAMMRSTPRGDAVETRASEALLTQSPHTLADEQPAEDRSPDLYRLLVSSALDYAIFALDVTGRVLSWNLGAERIKGYAAHEIIGRHFSIFYP